MNRPVGEGRRLADVVQERGQPEIRRVRDRRHPRTAACGPTGPRRGPCSGGCRAGRRAPERSPRAGRCRPAGEGRSTVEARRGASRARPRCARRTGAGRGPARAWIPASVAGSMDASSVAARRTARIIRRASSSKRTRGSPTARIVGPSRSARPSNGSSRTAPEPLGGPPALGAPRHRVDREVATGEVELDRHRRTRRDADAGSRRSRGPSGTS